MYENYNGPSRTASENFLQLLFLCTCQACRELDLHTNNEISALIRLLGFGHAQVRVSFCPVGAGRTTAANAELFAIDGLYSSAPAGQGFFEIEFDDMLDIVAFASEHCVGFLMKLLANLLEIDDRRM